MSPLRSFSAHAATPLRRASWPTWTRPVPQPIAPALTQWAQNHQENAPPLRVS